MIKAMQKENLKAFQDFVNADGEFKKAGLGCSLNLVIENLNAMIQNGVLSTYEQLHPYRKPYPDLTFREKDSFWEEFVKPFPPFHYHTVESGMGSGHVQMTGNMNAFLDYNWVIDRLFGLMREFENPNMEEVPEPAPVFSEGDVEPVTGHYVHLTVQGVPYRIYFEEAGQGIPLVCQHTAGCASRQYRHLMEDPELTKQFHVVAYDLPFHGNSLPPRTRKWWAEEYLLKKDFLLDFLDAFTKTLHLENGIFLGASLGGQLALDLAIDRPDLFKAVIGLGGSLKTRSTGISPYRRYAQPNECQNSQYIKIPVQNRWETSWTYSQSGPWVEIGDAYYYGLDHDIRETVGKISDDKCPCYICNGEYDMNTDIPDGEKLAAANPNIHYSGMKGLGHFPMVEDYPLLKEKYLMPILNEIRSKYF